MTRDEDRRRSQWEEKQLFAFGLPDLLTDRHPHSYLPVINAFLAEFGEFFAHAQVDLDGDENLIVIKHDYGVSSFENASTGFLEVLSVAWTITSARGTVILDEPGHNWHPTLQSRFFQYLLHKCPVKHVVLITHSPVYLIPVDRKVHLWRVFRKNQKGHSQIVRASIQMERLLMYKDVGHIAFADRVLLVEGVSDFHVLNTVHALLLTGERPDLKKFLKFQIVQGNSDTNIPDLLEICVKLRVPVCVLHDVDSVDGICGSKASEAKQIFLKEQEKASKEKGWSIARKSPICKELVVKATAPISFSRHRSNGWTEKYLNFLFDLDHAGDFQKANMLLSQAASDFGGSYQPFSPSTFEEFHNLMTICREFNMSLTDMNFEQITRLREFMRIKLSKYGFWLWEMSIEEAVGKEKEKLLKGDISEDFVRANLKDGKPLMQLVEWLCKSTTMQSLTETSTENGQ